MLLRGQYGAEKKSILILTNVKIKKVKKQNKTKQQQNNPPPQIKLFMQQIAWIKLLKLAGTTEGTTEPTHLELIYS